MDPLTDGNRIALMTDAEIHEGLAIVKNLEAEYLKENAKRIQKVKTDLVEIVMHYDLIGDRGRADGVRVAIDHLDDVIDGTVA